MNAKEKAALQQIKEAARNAKDKATKFSMGGDSANEILYSAINEAYEWTTKVLEETSAPAPQDDSAVLQARIAALESQVNTLELDRDDWKAAAQNANTLIDIQRTAEKKAFALEAENARMKEAIEKIEGVTPSGDMPALGTNAYTLWFIGNVARNALQASATPAPSAPATPKRPHTRYKVRYNVESEGYKVWDVQEQEWASGSFTYQEDAQVVADKKNGGE